MDDAKIRNSRCSICPELAFAGCLHGAWCSAHLTEHMEIETDCLAQFKRAHYFFVAEALKHLAEIEHKMFPIRFYLIEGATTVYADWHSQLTRLYTNAGAPYGTEEAGMLRWFKEESESEEGLVV